MALPGRHRQFAPAAGSTRACRCCFARVARALDSAIPSAASRVIRAPGRLHGTRRNIYCRDGDSFNPVYACVRHPPRQYYDQPIAHSGGGDGRYCLQGLPPKVKIGVRLVGAGKCTAPTCWWSSCLGSHITSSLSAQARASKQYQEQTEVAPEIWTVG